MDLTLILSALLMGLAGSAHCVAMCGSTCAALTQGGGAGPEEHAWRDWRVWLTRPVLGFQLARAGGYMLAGAVAAGGLGLVERLGALSPALRPLWTLLHLAALALGLWLLWLGRQPAWMEALGRVRSVPASTPPASADGWQSVTVVPMGASTSEVDTPARRGMPTKAATTAGALWVLWPCGLLQSALVVAALANHMWSGALVMGAFALASAPALVAAPALLWRLMHRKGAGERAMAWAVRLSGAGLAASAAWALWHDFWIRVAAYCVG